jgi:outer membrane autotransporter protein
MLRSRIGRRLATVQGSWKSERVIFGCVLASLASLDAPAQTVGPGTYNTTLNVAVGTTTVVGNTTIGTAGASPATLVTAGILVVDMQAGPSPGIVYLGTANGNGLFANGGTINVLHGINVFTVGGHAVIANGAGSVVTLNSGNLGTTGVGAGLVAIAGAVLNVTNTQVANTATATASVSAGHGAIAESGGAIHFAGTNRISTAAANAVALGASGPASRIDMALAPLITMTGSGSMGVYLYNGGQVDLAPATTLQMNGPSSIGLTVDNTVVPAGTLGSGMVVRFDGTQTTGASGTGIVAINGSNVALDSVSVLGSGAAMGVWARNGSTITLTGTNLINVAASTNPAFYTLANGRLATVAGSVGSIFNVTGSSLVAGLKAEGGSISSSGTTVTVSSQNGVGAYAGLNGAVPSRLDLVGNTITTTGTGAFGLEAYSNGTITGADTNVTTNGGEAAAFLYTYDNPPSSTVLSPATISMARTNVTATGAGTSGLFSRNWSTNLTNQFSMSGGALSTDATAIDAEGPLRIDFTGAARVAGQDALLYAYRYPNAVQKQATVVDVYATGGVELTGLAEADSNSIANLHLADRSHWTGQAYYASNVDVDATSTWTIPAESLLTQRVSNAGLVEFTAPVNDVYKNLFVRDYAGNGGTLGIHTYLGTDNSPSDKLVIVGGTASGTTKVKVTNVGGAGALTSADGIPVVEVESGGTTAPGAFSLDGRTAAGPYEYRLVRGGGTGNVADFWFLRSALDCSAAGAPSPPCPGPNPPGPPDPPAPPTPPPPPTPPGPAPDPNPPTPPGPTPPAPTPDPPAPVPTPPGPQPSPPAPPEYRAEVSLYTALPALALRYGWATLGNMHERIGEEEQLRDRNDLRERTTVNGAWVRVIGESGDADGDRRGIYGSGGPHYDYDLIALQAGLDVYAEEHDNQQRDHAGLYAAQGRIQSDVTHFNGIYAGSDSVKATSLGLYWSHFWQEGQYLDAVWQGTWAKATARSAGDYTLQRNGFGWAASLEGGYPLHDETRVLEPQAQIIYQAIDRDSAFDPAANVRFRNMDSLAARVGLRWANTWTLDPDRNGTRRLLTGWLRANLWREFKGQPVTEFSSADGYVPFKADLKGNWWQLNAGTTWQLDANFSVYANLGYQRGFDVSFDAWDGKVGLRWNW